MLGQQCPYAIGDLKGLVILPFCLCHMSSVPGQIQPSFLMLMTEVTM